MPRNAKNHMKPYTEAEERRIRRFAKARVSARETAAKVGRSPGALRYFAMVRGIRFRSIDRRR